MPFQRQLDEISVLMFSHGLRYDRSTADLWEPSLAKDFEYSPLGNSEIRLLKLVPSSSDHDLHLTLGHFQCDSSYRCKQSYIALSYCWGDPLDTAAIAINDCKLSITRSLRAALQEIQRRYGHDYIWIDAICINQGDKNERGHQILKMRDIYSNARETIVWLGTENEHTKEALSISDVLATGTPKDSFSLRTQQLLSNLPVRLRGIAGWASVAALVDLPYWRRTWIIQELAMSQSITILWGSHTGDLQPIALAIDAVHEYNPIMWSCLDGMNHLQDLLFILGRKKNVAEVFDNDLISMLSWSSLSKASEPSDKVFGILGLARDGFNVIPEPDYQEPMDSIFRRITIKKLTGACRQQVVDIICLDSVHHPKRAGLPSWVIDWASHWNFAEGNVVTSLPIRYLSSAALTIYKACGGSSPSVQISSDGLTLICRGYFFDKVQDLSPFNSRGGWETSFEKGGLSDFVTNDELLSPWNVYGTDSNLYNAICRSVVREPWRVVRSAIYASGVLHTSTSFAQNFQRIFTETRKPCWVPTEWMETYKEAGNFKVHGKKLKDWAAHPPQQVENLNNIYDPRERDPAELDFWDSVQIGRLGRRMMETSKGYVGIAHSQSHVGDSVVLLQGASVPIILRPCEGGYLVIGEAYVHGIMEGEFWEAQDEGKMQDFCLK